MSVNISPTQQTIFTALRSFILGLIDCEVIQGLGNNTPMPLGGFIAMTALLQNRLSTNIDTYTDPVIVDGTKDVMQPTQYTIQIDCYGAYASDWAVTICALFRDEYGCTALAPSVQPLHADDPKMIPLSDGEMQYEERWSITAALQYNPVISVPQQFADSLQVDLINVDANFPP